MSEQLGSEWTTLRAGGAIAHHDERLNLDLSPRVMLEYTARVNDPVSFGLFAGTRDPDELTSWLGQVLVQVCKTFLAPMPIMNAMSGAYPLAEDVTPLANAEYAPLGVEIAVTTFMVSLSEEDREAVDRIVEEQARSQLGQLGAQLATAEAMMTGGDDPK